MSFDIHDDEQPIAQINMTPLIDVMLVLLVIFIITAPLMVNHIKLDLPKEKNSQSQEQFKPMVLSIDAQGQFFWNKTLMTPAQLAQHCMQLSNEQKEQTVQIFADKQTNYEWIAKAMSILKQANLSKIAFAIEQKS